MCLSSRGPVNVGTEKRKERCLDSHPQPLSNKNHKKCDELVKKRDELVTGACLRVKKRGAARTRQAGEDCSHGDTKARRKAECGEAVVTSDERRVVSGQECGEQKQQLVHVPSLHELPRRTPALNYDFSFILN